MTSFSMSRCRRLLAGAFAGSRVIVLERVSADSNCTVLGVE
jgi:hypothetical protein